MVRTYALLSLFFIILGKLTIAIALSVSSSRLINVVETPWDPRISQLTQSEQAPKEFIFDEPNIAAFSAKLNIRYSAGRDLEEYPVDRFFDGLQVKVQRINDDGGRIRSIEIKPKLLLLWPSFKFGAIPVLFAALFYAMIYAVFKLPGSFRLFPPLLATPLIGLFLGENRLDYFDRGVWLWILLMLMGCGGLLYRYLTTAKDEARSASASPRAYAAAVLVGIFLIGLLLRFNGLDFGLPGLFHPDESRKIKIARGMVETGDLNPHYFRHPTFLLYATAFNTWVYSKITGEIPPLSTVAYLGRSVSATLGSLSVILVFLIGKLLYSRNAGLLAAAFLALSPLHVVCSKYIKEDASLLFFTLLCFYFAVRALKNQCSVKFTLLAALFAGFSASSKYSGLLNISFAFLPVYERIAAALNLKRLRFTTYELPFSLLRLFSLPVLIIICFAAGFIILTPFAVLDHEAFLYDFLGEKQHMQRGHTVAISPISYYWGFHIKRSILSSFQLLFAVLSFIGLGFLAARAKLFDLLIIAAVLLFYLPSEYVRAKPEPQPERYVLPCIPFLAIAASEIATRLMRAPSTAVRYAVVIFTALALIQTAHYSLSHGQAAKNDTRLQAKNWIREKIPPGSKIIIDWHFYGPPGLKKEYQIMDLKDKSAAKLARGISEDTLKATGYDYAVLSSFSYGRFLMVEYRAHNLSKRYKQLFESMSPMVTFENEQYAYGFHNPEIKIFKLK